MLFRISKKQTKYFSSAEKPLLHSKQAGIVGRFSGNGSISKDFDGTCSRVSAGFPQYMHPLGLFFPNLCNNPLRQNDFVAFFESCSSPRKHKGIIIVHYVYMFSLLKRISKDLIVWQKYYYISVTRLLMFL